jgi:ABC-2 type transport system permease protein
MMPSVARVAALLQKEWLDLRGTLAPWLPGLLMLPAVALPFVFGVLVPGLAGEPLEDSDFGAHLDAFRQTWPAVASLPARAAVQVFVFQQFLTLVLLVPVTGAMSLAAHGVIGERQGRTLEPLLATPMTTVELLLAKMLTAWLPSVAMGLLATILYFVVVAAVAEPGVVSALVSLRTALLVLVGGPLLTAVALQLVVLTSTRARDPRSAQQVGVLVVLPLMGLLVAQGTGVFWLTVPAILGMLVVLVVVWLALLGLSVAVFEPERMLTW